MYKFFILEIKSEDMNKVIFVGIGIAIVLIIAGFSFSLETTEQQNVEITPTEIEELPETPSEGKNLEISFSDGISARENP